MSQQQNANKLTLSAAMETLRSMFPDFDNETLKSTLYKTNGHMERTIEHLLVMQESRSSGSSGTQHVAPTFSPPSPPTTTTTTAQSQPVITRAKNSKTVRHNLPPSFLRYEDEDEVLSQVPSNNTHNDGHHHHPSSTSSSSSLSSLQQMNDEAYARELQRMMFYEQHQHQSSQNQSSQPNRRQSTTSTSQRNSHNTPTSSTVPQTVQGPKTSRESMRGFGVNNKPVQSNFSDRIRRKLADVKEKFSSREQQQQRNNQRRRNEYDYDEDDFLDREDNL